MVAAFLGRRAALNGLSQNAHVYRRDDDLRKCEWHVHRQSPSRRRRRGRTTRRRQRRRERSGVRRPPEATESRRRARNAHVQPSVAREQLRRRRGRTRAQTEQRSRGRQDRPFDRVRHCGSSVMPPLYCRIKVATEECGDRDAAYRYNGHYGEVCRRQRRP